MGEQERDDHGRFAGSGGGSSGGGLSKWVSSKAGTSPKDAAAHAEKQSQAAAYAEQKFGAKSKQADDAHSGAETAHETARDLFARAGDKEKAAYHNTKKQFHGSKTTDY